MTVKPVLHIDNPILRRKTKLVSKIDKSIFQLVDDLMDTLEKCDGAGLAAPQIGVSMRVAVVWLPEQDPVVLINPVIVKRIGVRKVDEGCLSLPGYQGNIKRSVAVTAKWLDLNGCSVKIRATDLMAQVLEHEIDHLDGVLYIDHLETSNSLFKVEPKKENETDVSVGSEKQNGKDLSEVSVTEESQCATDEE